MHGFQAQMRNDDDGGEARDQRAKKEKRGERQEKVYHQGRSQLGSLVNVNAQASYATHEGLVGRKQKGRTSQARTTANGYFVANGSPVVCTLGPQLPSVAPEFSSLISAAADV